MSLRKRFEKDARELERLIYLHLKRIKDLEQRTTHPQATISIRLTELRWFLEELLEYQERIESLEDQEAERNEND